MTPFEVSRRSILAGLFGAGMLPGAAWAGKANTVHHYQAPFFTAHVIPGSPIVLSEHALRAEGQNVVALTFDDGPDTVNDREILRILAEYKAVATFFVVGSRAVHHVDMLKEMVAAGNEVGNHTWSHPMLTTLSPEQQAEELRKTDEVIATAGIVPKWFRPSYGDYDSHVLGLAQGEHLDTILWSVDSKDYRGRAPEIIASKVVGDLHPGAVILMHSIKHNTVLALPEILRRAQAAGYRFVTMSEWQRIMIETDSAMKLAQQQTTPVAAVTR
ncbi:MAG: polysaccharide deacetylase family protein [Azospirillum sp.]|nr:polysaccharide deacetylase family protein [Azospirillum sp.]